MNRLPNLILLLALLSSCQIAPKPIEFGFDACHFCKMTIVDNRHAAELVTEKGKVYVFDAIECMLMALQQNDEGKAAALRLVCTMDDPGQLTSAENCTYLISNALPSPMGAFLSAFTNPQEAARASSLPGDRIMDWDMLNETFRSGAIKFSGQ